MHGASLEHPKRRRLYLHFSCRLSWGFFLSSCWFWQLNFSIPLFLYFSLYGRETSAMMELNILVNIEKIESGTWNDFKRIFFTSKQLFANDPVTCMTWIYDIKITSTSTAEISLKLFFQPFSKGSRKRIPPRSLFHSEFRLLRNRRISFISISLTTHKARFAQLKSLFFHGHPSIWNLSTCNVT